MIFLGTGKRLVTVLVLSVVVLGLFFVAYYYFQDTNIQNQKAKTNGSFEFEYDDIEPEAGDNFDLGQYYFNQDGEPSRGSYDLKKARYYYSKALEEDPVGNEKTWYQLGRIDFIEGKFLSALYKFDKQIEYFGDEVPNVYYMIGLTYGYMARRSGESEEWGKGEEAFLNFLEFEEYQDSPWARTDLSWIYFAQGKFEEMIPVLEPALESYPSHSWVLNMYGLALMNTGEPALALVQFHKAKEHAQELDALDWGNSYPGNNPDDWEQGLSEFIGAIEKNIELLEGQ